MSPILGGIGGVSVRGFGHFPNLYFSSFDSIATVTVGAGGSSFVEFTSIPATYTHLQIRGISRSDTNTTGDLTFNNDTGNNYSFHDIYGDGSVAGAEASASRANIPITQLPNAANIVNGFVCDILDYANTNKYKTVRCLSGRDQNGSGVIYLFSGLWQNTNAITSLKITGRAANIGQYSSFALYGIKVA